MMQGIILKEAIGTLGRESICERIAAKRNHRELKSDSLSGCLRRELMSSDSYIVANRKGR